MNSYYTKLIKWNQINKSNGMNENKRNETNQIKSTQTQEMITQHGFDSYEYIWNQFHNAYQQYSILISIERTPKWIQ